MIAEGYRSTPLSDELERRIRERLNIERNESRQNARMDRHHMAAICDGRVSALEWVLNEAQAITESVPEAPPPRMNACPDCGHEHLDEKRCNFPYAMDRECKCERKMSA
jgi:hypothetical protein